MPRLTVAHDYICPWCWAGWHQSRLLKTEFPTLEFDWKGHELLPEGMEYTPTPPDPNAPKKPRVPTRMELLLSADGLQLPERKRPLSRSRMALEGAEFAREAGKAEEYHDAIYHTYWEEDRDIADLAILTEVAERIGLDGAAFRQALEQRVYRDRIVEFDAPSYAAGIWNVPTWEFPEEWVAEQPYSVVRAMTERFVRDHS